MKTLDQRSKATLSHLSHLSHSGLSLLEGCPYCFVQKYVNGRTPPERDFLKLGIKWHNEVDKYHRNLPYDHGLISTYVQKLINQNTDKELLLKDPDAAIEQARQKARKYRLQSEVPFKHIIKIGDWETPVPIKGFIDGTTKNKGLCDMKVAVAIGSKLNESQQGLIYAAVQFQRHPELEKVRFDWNWINKKKDYQLKTITVFYTREQIQKLLLPKLQKAFRMLEYPPRMLETIPGKYYFNHFEECERSK